MADAVSAFKEAFNFYKGSIVDYIAYSFLMSISAFAASTLMFAAIFIATILSAGFMATAAGSTEVVSLGIFGIAAVVVVLGIGALISLWVYAGIHGAFLETMNMFVSGRKQSLKGFFSAVPHHATPIFMIYFIAAFCIAVPIALLSVLLAILKLQAIYFAILILGAGLAGILGLLFFFAVPAAVVERKGAVAALKSSISLTSKNLVHVIAFAIIACLIALPGAVLMLAFGLGGIYLALFAVPVIQSALVLFYKKAK